MATTRSIKQRIAAAENFSVVETLARMVEGKLDPEDIPEAVQFATKWSGMDPSNSLVVSLRSLRRDLTFGAASAGGATVGSPRNFDAESLRGFSVTADAGLDVFVAPEGNTPSIPVVDTPPVAAFVASEGGAVPDSDAVFALRTGTTYTGGVRCNVSRKFLLSTRPEVKALVSRELLSACGRLIDKAVLQGNGSNEPTGLLTVSGVHDQAGASLAWAGIAAMFKAVADGGARDEDRRFIGASAVRELLQKREKATGSGIVWSGGAIDGVPASVSRECPAGTLFLGDWSQMTAMIHGGIRITVDPRVSPSGTHRLVVMFDLAVEARQPAAFSRATSVT